jgi:hypothetical protein
MFVLCKLFKPNLLFSFKAGNYPNEVPIYQILDQPGKACTGESFKLSLQMYQ